MSFYCSNKNGICDYDFDFWCSGCEHFNNSSGEEVHTGAVQISDTVEIEEFVVREARIDNIEYAVYCLICDEVVETVPYFEMSGPCVCDKCKAAVMKVREQYEQTSTD